VSAPSPVNGSPTQLAPCTEAYFINQSYALANADAPKREAQRILLKKNKGCPETGVPEEKIYYHVNAAYRARKANIRNRKVQAKQRDRTAAQDVSGSAASDSGQSNVIADSVIQPAKGPDGFLLNEGGNAQRFLADHAINLKWISGSNYRSAGTFFHWAGQRWLQDSRAHVWELAKSTTQKIFGWVKMARNRDDAVTYLSWFSRSSTSKGLDAMITIARTAVSIRRVEFDADIMLFGTRNGVIDLRTGECRQPQREDLMTKQGNVIYDPIAKCPIWDNFLYRTTNGDRELMRYLQQLAGIGLTGETKEHSCFIVYGPGGTGKTTFEETLKYIYGDYAVGIDPNSLAATDRVEPGKARPDLVKLYGARMAFANETQAGLILNAALIKALTGGDTITARQLYEPEFDFVPTHKLWMRTNYKPYFDGSDTGMQRRIRLIPFENVLPKDEQDLDLSEKLRGEASGILNWALEGLKDYRENGLVEPEIVKKSTVEHVSVMDTIGLFIETKCELNPEYDTQGSQELYDSYRTWIDKRGQRPLALNRFVETVRSKGFSTYQDRTKKHFWRGLRTKPVNGNPEPADIDGQPSRRSVL
jgi:putative DNA primase/helicase